MHVMKTEDEGRMSAARGIAAVAVATWLAGCGTEPLAEEPAMGTAASPIVIDQLPFGDEGDTSRAREAQVGPRACSEDSEGSGPEVHYELVVERPGRLRAAVDDAAGVDVDLLLFDADGAPRCLAWVDEVLDGWLDTGVYHLVVDTYAGRWLAGPYHLDVELVEDR